MDIAALATDMKDMQFRQQVGISVAKLSMDMIQENFAETIRMMEQSVSPNLGSNLDIQI